MIPGNNDFFEWHYARIDRAHRHGLWLGFFIGLAVGIALAAIAIELAQHRSMQ